MNTETNFETMFCRGKINIMTNKDLIIRGRIDDTVQGGEIFYAAASPADHRATFTGSGLPFYNQLQAFDNSPNIGYAKLDEKNNFTIQLMVPNSYAVGLGSVIVPPTVYIEYTNGNNEARLITVKVSEGIPFRHLTYPMNPRARMDATFYDSQFGLQVRSQEQILLESAYPKVNKTPSNYFGTKPPL